MGGTPTQSQIKNHTAMRLRIRR